MRIVDCEQRSDEWHVHRMVRATTSNFGKIITPAKGQLSKTYRKYAAELITKQLGLFTEPPPTFWMEWGTEHEPIAVRHYETEHKVECEKVGFVLPDDTDAYGGSPDALVSDREGVLEVKCPAPQTLIEWHCSGELPVEHKPQVQGLLLLTGCEWCDFYGFHPDLKPLCIRVEPNTEYQDAMKEALETFHAALKEMTAKVVETGAHIIQWGE